MKEIPFGKTRDERRLFLDTYKTQKGCEECGYNKAPEALQLDHLDPNTKYRTKNGKTLNPGEMIGMSQSIFFTELRKCRVLCSNCHAIHSKKQQAEIRALNTILKMSEVSDKVDVC
jgi:hypothetical protein